MKLFPIYVTLKFRLSLGLSQKSLWCPDLDYPEKLLVEFKHFPALFRNGIIESVPRSKTSRQPPVHVTSLRMSFATISVLGDPRRTYYSITRYFEGLDGFRPRYVSEVWKQRLCHLQDFRFSERYIDTTRERVQKMLDLTKTRILKNNKVSILYVSRLFKGVWEGSEKTQLSNYRPNWLTLGLTCSLDLRWVTAQVGSTKYASSCDTRTLWL